MVSDQLAVHVGIDARLYYYRQGGIGQYAVRLIRGLAALDPEDRFTVFQSRVDRGVIIDAPHVRRRSLWTPCHHRLEQVTLPLELATVGLDVLHCPDFIPPFRRRCPAVITVHDLAFLLYPSILTPDSARYYGQIRRAVESAEGIIAVSHNTQRDMQQLLGVPADRVTVIHHAAEERFRPLSDQAEVDRYLAREGLPRDFILFVGTVEPRKNLTTLLRAYGRLLKEADLPGGWRTGAGSQSPDPQPPPGSWPKLVLAGARGWLYDEVYRVVEQFRLMDHVISLEEVTPDDLVFLYNAARLFVFPSLYEGFGFPPLEAMACGTPVVSSNTSSLPEVVGNAALTVDPRDEVALAEAIWRGLTDETLRSNLRAAGLRQAASFSWHTTVEQTLEVYRKAARR